MAFKTGDNVRIDIPNQGDPDHDLYHGSEGQIVDVLADDAGSYTGDVRDGYLYRVKLKGDVLADFRWRDLRPI